MRDTQNTTTQIFPLLYPPRGRHFADPQLLFGELSFEQHTRPWKGAQEPKIDISGAKKLTNLPTLKMKQDLETPRPLSGSSPVVLSADLGIGADATDNNKCHTSMV